MKPRIWRQLITVVVLISVVIGLAAAGLGLWDLHKVNEANGKIAASIDNSVAATSIVSPISGQTISGVISLDSISLDSFVKSVQFVLNGGSSHNVHIGTGALSIAGWGTHWNTANFPNGTYTITSIGYNTVGKSARSPVVTVHIHNL